MRRRFALLLGAAIIITNLVPTPAGAQNDDRKREHLQLECRAIEGTAVACKWSTSDNPKLAGYRLFRTQRWMGQVVYRGTETSFVDKDVKPGRHYFYVAQAIDADGQSLGRSNVERVRIPPERPERLKLECSVVPAHETDTAQADLADQKAVACKWSASTDPDLDHYRLGRFTRGGRQVVYRGKDTSFVDREVRPGQYRYVVGSYNAKGRLIGWSNETKVKVPPRPEPKRAPEPEPKPAPEPRPKPRPEPEPKPVPFDRIRLACKATGPERLSPTARPAVVCEWSPVKDPAGYVLWRSDGNGPRQVVHKTRDGLRFVDTTVAAGHRYHYAVMAMNSGGETIARSEVVVVAVPRDASPQPAKPTSPAREASTKNAA
jgi:fibronectin type 3 domain-containing protein